MKNSILRFFLILLIPSQLFAAAGVTVYNNSGNRLKVMVDKAKKTVFLKAKEEKFIPTAGYGDRAIAWVDSGVTYKTKPYSYPHRMVIRKFGNYDLTERTLFGKTEHKGERAPALDAQKKVQFYEKRRAKIIETNSIDELKKMLDQQKKLIANARKTGATQAELKEELEILQLIKDSIKTMEKTTKKLQIGTLKEIGNKFKQTECPISLEEFSEKDTDITKLPCGHIFKKDAILGWLKTKNICPLCRKPVK